MSSKSPNINNNQNPNIIEVKGLTRTYGDGRKRKKTTQFTALNKVDLSIKRGESVAIVGKSGSGKSTLMHLLALMDSPTSGRIFIDGKDSTKLKTSELNRIRNEEFGFVFQQFFLNGNDTVLNNVILPLKIAGVGTKERNELGRESLKAVEILSKEKRKANDLSGGEKQRTVIARALINDPSVIFADEPTGNLDSVTGKKIEDILFRLNKEKGITLIVVTHDTDLAQKCDRQIYIKDGEITRKL